MKLPHDTAAGTLACGLLLTLALYALARVLA